MKGGRRRKREEENKEIKERGKIVIRNTRSRILKVI
jgi:hypothetical protein